MDLEKLEPVAPDLQPVALDIESHAVEAAKDRQQIQGLERLKLIFSKMVTAETTELLSYTCYELTNAKGKPLNAFSFVYRNNGKICYTVVLQGTDSKILAYVHDFDISDSIPWRSSHILETIRRGEGYSIPVQLVHLHVLQRIADSFGEQIDLVFDKPTLPDLEEMRRQTLCEKLGFNGVTKTIHPAGWREQLDNLQKVEIVRYRLRTGGGIIGCPVGKSYVPNDQREVLLEKGKAHALQILQTIERQLQNLAS